MSYCQSRCNRRRRPVLIGSVARVGSFQSPLSLCVRLTPIGSDWLHLSVDYFAAGLNGSPPLITTTLEPSQISFRSPVLKFSSNIFLEPLVAMRYPVQKTGLHSASYP